MPPAPPRLLLSLCLLATLACGSDEVDAEGPTGQSGGPLYVVHSGTQDPDGMRSNFFTLTSSLLKPELLDYGRAIEQKGRSRLYAQPDLGFFAIGVSETRTITRYTIDAGDRMVPGASLSLDTYGVKSMDAQAVHFVSETKAYYKDAGEGQIIVWNPKEMAVLHRIELPAEVLKPGYLTSFSQWAAAGDQAYVAIGWTTKDYDRVLPGSKLLRIDTRTDAVQLTDDARCRGLNRTANVAGALYFFSDVITAFGQAVYPNDGGQPACALRINAGDTTFDPGYLGNVAAALGPRQGGTVIGVTPDEVAWVQAVDLNVAPTAPGSKYNDWYDRGWSWVRVPLSTLASATPVPLPPGAFSSLASTASGEFQVSQADPDYARSTLISLASGTPKPGVSFPGFALDVARLR